MSRATYKLEIAWTADPGLVAKIGIWAIGTHRLGGGVAEADWTDETTCIRFCTITRGRTGDLGAYPAGTCDIGLNDSNGTYNPANAGNSLSPNVVPMRPVRITATFGGTDYRRFYGYIQTIRDMPNLSQQSAAISAADGFAWLQNIKPTIAAMGATTTGAAINKVLDVCGLDSVLRDIDTGDTLSDFSADGTVAGLTLIQNLTSAAQGNFLFSREGKAVFEDRNARFVSPRNSDQSTMAGTFQSITASVDVAQILNYVTCTKTGGAAQTVQDATSQGSYGRRDYSLTSDHWPNDAWALLVAAFIKTMNKDPKVPIDIEIMNDSDVQLTALLARDLCDRVGISETRAGTSGSYFIESISEQITNSGSLHSATWRLSRRELTPFILGYAQIDRSFISY